VTEEPNLPAGGFSSWLRQARKALINKTGMDVACGECDACCGSSYFIHVGLDETKALALIPKGALAALPGQSKKHVLLGYRKNGLCPMLLGGKCSIYEHRPRTCRSYDCRIFAAAGISAGDDKPRINQRIRRWKFSYLARRDREEHAAVRAAAKFIQGHAECFPGGKIPKDPNQLAVLAIKAYGVFLGKDGIAAETGGASNQEVANAIVKEIREFDTKRRAAEKKQSKSLLNRWA
jgi:Fe-S-cluster containining protein